eukprot:GILJ01013026.1.p1 GENE.GILJ01013026.1~~GILJ01013026.1.p1  ORF type:complete len:302 (-),score=29.52 GILJ01013026.1:63-968(-)
MSDYNSLDVRLLPPSDGDTHCVDDKKDGCLRPYDVEREEPSKRRRRKLLRRLYAEVLGTFLLVVMHGGFGIVLKTTNKITLEGVSVGCGLVVLAIVFAIGGVSGAHLNPVVTTAFAVRGSFPRPWVLPYFAAQVVGSVLAAVILKGLFPEDMSGAACALSVGEGRGLAFEVLLTFILIFVILCISTRGKVLGVAGGITVGSTVTFLIMIGGSYSSACLNPTRMLGPALLASRWEGWWVFVVGPFLGALVAVVAVWLLASNLREDELTVAGGGHFGEPIPRKTLTGLKSMLMGDQVTREHIQ